MAEEEKNTPRMVNCVKLVQELPGLERPPRNDELGKRIFENVSAQAWQMWLEQQTLLINHYGLNMVDSQAHTFLTEQMEEFFFSEEAAEPEGWIPEDQRGQQPPPSDGGKGAPGGDGKGAPGGGGKGAPSSGGKGAPAPSSK